jgi:hypothetical protein
MEDYILNQGYAAPVWFVIAGNLAHRAYEEFQQIKEDKTKIASAAFDSATALMAGGMCAICALDGLEKLLARF